MLWSMNEGYYHLTGLRQDNNTTFFNNVRATASEMQFAIAYVTCTPKGKITTKKKNRSYTKL